MVSDLLQEWQQEQLEDSSTAKHGHHEFETFNGRILKDLAVAPEFKTCGKGLRMCSNLFIARSKEWSPLSTSSCGKEWLVKMFDSQQEKLGAGESGQLRMEKIVSLKFKVQQRNGPLSPLPKAFQVFWCGLGDPFGVSPCS